MPNRKQLLISAGVTLALALVYFLWKRGWSQEQVSSFLVVLADSFTVAGVLDFLAGFLLRGRTHARLRRKRNEDTAKSDDLTGEDSEHGRKVRRLWGNALFLCAAVSVALSVVISILYGAL